jgi:hypothetical protein
MVRDLLLLGGTGFAALALLLLMAGAWVGPPHDNAVRAVPPSATPWPPHPTVSPWPAQAGQVNPLPVPVPTDAPASLPFQPLCGGVRAGPPLCTPGPVLPTPTAPLLSPTPWPGTLQTDETGQADFGTWRYGYGVIHAEADTRATVYYDTHSIAALQAYAAANQALAAELAGFGGGARVDVTFRTYLTPAEVEDWMVAHDLYNGWLGVRVLDAQDQRADLALPVYNKQQFPQSALEHWLTPIPADPSSARDGLLPPDPPAAAPADKPVAQAATPTVMSLPTPRSPLPTTAAPGPPFSVVGVYYLSGMVDAQRLPAIAADPLVFLADVTPNIVRRDLLRRGVLAPAPNLDWVTIQPPSPFWAMEDLGLEHFR